MQLINPFSVILILIIGFIIYSSKSVKELYLKITVLTIVIHALNLQGYFIYIAGERYYSTAVNLVYMIISLYYIKESKIQIDRKTILWSSALLSSITIGIMYFLLDPYTGMVVSGNGEGIGWDDYARGRNVEGSARLYYGVIFFFYIYIIDLILTVIILRDNLRVNEYYYIVKWSVRILYLEFFYGILEFSVKNFINAQVLYDFKGMIFGSGKSTVISAFERDGLQALDGFTREPSHFAFALFVFLLLIFIKKKCLMNCSFSKGDILTIISSGLLMYLSGSFSSILYICAFLGVLIVYKINQLRKEKRIFIYLGLMFIIAFAILYIMTTGMDTDSYFGKRINGSFLVISMMTSNNMIGMSGFSSELARFLSIYETWIDFIERPILGLGVSVEPCHGAWMTFLSYTGIIGALLLLKTLFFKYKYDKKIIFIIYIFPFIFVGIVDWLIALPMTFIVLMLRQDFIQENGVNE